MPQNLPGKFDLQFLNKTVVGLLLVKMSFWSDTNGKLSVYLSISRYVKPTKKMHFLFGNLNPNHFPYESLSTPLLRKTCMCSYRVCVCTWVCMWSKSDYWILMFLNVYIGDMETWRCYCSHLPFWLCYRYLSSVQCSLHGLLFPVVQYRGFSHVHTNARAVEQSLAEFCIYNAVVWWWFRLSEMKHSLLS